MAQNLRTLWAIYSVATTNGRRLKIFGIGLYIRLSVDPWCEPPSPLFHVRAWMRAMCVRLFVWTWWAFVVDVPRIQKAATIKGHCARESEREVAQPSNLLLLRFGEWVVVLRVNARCCSSNKECHWQPSRCSWFVSFYTLLAYWLRKYVCCCTLQLDDAYRVDAF